MRSQAGRAVPVIRMDGSCSMSVRVVGAEVGQAWEHLGVTRVNRPRRPDRFGRELWRRHGAVSAAAPQPLQLALNTVILPGIW